MFRATTAMLAAGLLCAAASGVARADAPFSFDSTFGKLPKTVVPIDYDIALHPDLKALTFAGNESVRVRVRAATSTIVLNTHDITVSRATIDGHPVAGIATDNAKQTTTFTATGPVSSGMHTVVIAYAGKIGAAPSGLFYQPYADPDGTKHVMLATQMESTDARRMFPSWDEPAFRATYRLTVTVPRSFDAVSNMPATAERVDGDSKTVSFARTPKMSSYLVVLSAGEFGYLEGQADGIKVRVVAPKGREQNGRYALDSAEKLLSYYDDYFGIKYPLPKLDLIDLPGGFPGAMENWGGITFTEQLLMFDPAVDAPSAKEDIFKTIAHEMSHQWTGDLVTMAWWDGLWLNESFADWMQTKATDHFNPSWKMWERVNGDVETAMRTDGQMTTHPVQTPIADETQADAAFDEITYQKGGAFVRMMEQYLGEDTFRDGIRRYVRANAYGNATSADLYGALGAVAKQDVGTFATAWTTEPGFPLITVAERCDGGKTTVDVSQKRFYYEAGQTSAQLWQVPLVIAPASHPEAAHTVLLTAQKATYDGGPCGEPVLVNAGATGYFRVQYDPATTAALTQRIEQLGAADRVRILADSSAFVIAGTAEPSILLDEVGRLGGDGDLAVWSQTIGAIDNIADDERGHSGQSSFDAYRRAVLEPVFARVGWEGGDDPTIGTLRARLIGELADAGDPKIIAGARERFAKFLGDPSSLPPAMRETVLSVVASYADEPTWEKLHTMALSAKSADEAQVYLQALAHARDAALASKNLAMATNGDIPAEAGPIPALIDVAYVAVLGHQPQLAWAFYKVNAPKLTAQLSAFEQAGISSKILPYFWQAAPPADLEAFAKSHSPAGAAPGIAQAMHEIDLQLAVAQRVLPAVDRWVASHPSGATALQ